VAQDDGAARPVQHARGNRVVRRQHLLAQAGVPGLLFAALLVVVAYNAGPRRQGGPARPVASTGLSVEAEQAARARLEALEAYAAAHPEAALEVYERAQELSASLVPEVAQAASRLREGAVARFDQDLRDELGRGRALEAEGHDVDAGELYKAYLSRPGLNPDAARVVRDALGRVTGRLQERFVHDTAALRDLVAAGRRAEAEALVDEIGRYGGPASAAAARALLAQAPPPATEALPAGGDARGDAEVDPALLGRALAGAVEDAGGGAVRLRYTFDDPGAAGQLDDWPACAQSFSGPLQPADLEGLEPRDHPAWFVQDGVLVGEGWTRRQLAIDLRPDRPVTVEALVRGTRSRAVGLGLLPGRCLLGGSGLQLDLPLERVPRRTPRLEADVQAARDRGPVAGLVREARFLELDDLLVEAAPPRPVSRLVLSLVPVVSGDPWSGQASLSLRLDDRRLPPVPVTLDDGPLRVFLVALGAPVAYDEVVVTGTPSPDLARALPGLAADAPGGALGPALRAWLARRHPPIRLR
jgi:hypothetical protein